MSSGVDWGATGATTGGSSTELTVRRNVRCTASGGKPSSTADTVIVVVPDAFATGVIVSVREAPVPVTASPPASTTVAFDERAVTVTVSPASGSPTVSGITTGVSSLVV